MDTHSRNDLLDRYLRAFESHLPRAHRADILAEMSDSMQTRIEEQESAVGRALSVDETSAILKEYGPPVVAASKYWKQQQLVGPRFLPYYWSTLQVALWCAVALNVVALFGVSFMTSGNVAAALGKVWGTAILSALAVVGAMTLAFAFLERFAQTATFSREWDPRTLELVDKGKSLPRIQSACEFVVNGVIALWLLSSSFVQQAFAAVWSPATAAVASPLPLGLAPVWQWGVLALTVGAAAQALVAFATLVRPNLALVRALTLLATNAFLGVVAFAIAAARPLIRATPNVHHLPPAAALQAANAVLFWSLIIAGIVCVALALGYLRSALRLARRRSRTPLAAIALA